MPVTPSEFNALELLVESIDARLVVVEDLLDESVTGSIVQRLAAIEESMVSINQAVALKETLEDDIQSNTDELEAIGTEVQAIRSLINALNRWRLDLRHELVYEQATGNLAGTLWTLTNEYDETSPFVVFQANLTLVDPSLITFSDPESMEFTSSVALTNDVHVIYFKKIPTGN